MIRKSVVVNVEEKEAARPIALLVQLASQFKSVINICEDNKTVNAKSIMGMMTLGLVPGQTLELSIDGEDENEAMESIEKFLCN